MAVTGYDDDRSPPKSPGHGAYVATLFTKTLSAEEYAQGRTQAEKTRREFAELAEKNKRMTALLAAEGKQNACPKCQGEYGQCEGGNSEEAARYHLTCPEVFHNCVQRSLYTNATACKLPR
jgi:hypothetical protein